MTTCSNYCLATEPTSVYSPGVEQTPFAGRSSARLLINPLIVCISWDMTSNYFLATVPTSVYGPRVEQTPFAGRSSERLLIKVADRLYPVFASVAQQVWVVLHFGRFA